MATLGERLKRSWNAFMGRDPTRVYGSSFTYDPSSMRRRYSFGGIRNIVKSIYNRIAVDCSQIDIRHVRLNENNQFEGLINSELDNCLFLSPNLDQTAEAFIRDCVMSMFDEGVVAIVPVETTENPQYTDSYDVLQMRAARIVEWMPKTVRVECYNQETGNKEQIVVEKRYTPIVENPFYETMNEPNAVAQRLNRVLNQLDVINNNVGTDRLDLIIQLPYGVKSPTKREQAILRKKDLEEQLTGGRGIAYIDATEKVVQLNRPIENSLLEQAKDLEMQLYNQLGLTQAIFDGTADEKVLLNYYNRAIEPILSAIVREMMRKWLSKTARTQRQGIAFFRDPFKLVPVNDLAEIADKFTRNEIMSSNEFRSVIGMKRADDAKADQLVNSNINYGDTTEGQAGVTPTEDGTQPAGTEQTTGEQTDQSQHPSTSAQMMQSFDNIMQELMNGIESDIDSIISNLGGKPTTEEVDENADDTES